MKRRTVVPFFLSHQGCPNRCVFCDQTVITGVASRLPAASEIASKVEEYSRSSGGNGVDVAFYGGSFTLLPMSDQKSLLESIAPLRDAGTVKAVKISTRPDGVNDEAARFLREQGVNVVELGVQSMDQEVLVLSRRGHGAWEVGNAVGHLRKAGLQVGIQLMPGLPGDTPTKSFQSLRRALDLKPDFLRIYPTVVIEGTELAERYRRGEYAPLSLAEAVSIGKVLLAEAYREGVPVIRFGIHPGEELQSGVVVAGPFHPALRQLVEAELMFDLLVETVGDGPSSVSVECHPSRVADVMGQHRGNIRRLQAEKGLRVERVTGNAAVARTDLVVISEGKRRMGSLLA